MVTGKRWPTLKRHMLESTLQNRQVKSVYSVGSNMLAIVLCVCIDGLTRIKSDV